MIKILFNKYEEYESNLIDLITMPKSNDNIVDINKEIKDTYSYIIQILIQFKK